VQPIAACQQREVLEVHIAVASPPSEKELPIEPQHLDERFRGVTLRKPNTKLRRTLVLLLGRPLRELAEVLLPQLAAPRGTVEPHAHVGDRPIGEADQATGRDLNPHQSGDAHGDVLVLWQMRKCMACGLQKVASPLDGDLERRSVTRQAHGDLPLDP
jgi:hypothetical protein